MATYIVNKGSRSNITREFRFEAESHVRSNDVVQFLNKDGELVKEIKSDLVQTVDIER